MKLDYFLRSRKIKRHPAKLMPPPPISSYQIEMSSRIIRDEILTARKLYQAETACRLSVQRYLEGFPGTAETMSECANQHRRLFWYAAMAAVRELGVMLAGANDWNPLTHDELGADLPIDQRRLIEWLVDEGRLAALRRHRR